MSFQEKVVLITGGGSGIGQHTAFGFCEQGAHVVVADLNEPSAQTTAQEIQKRGGKALALKSDICREADVAAMVASSLKHFGRLDIAINNAGIGGLPAPTHDYPVETWQKVIDVNLTGVFLCMKYQIPAMMNKGGSIINISSAAGLSGFAKHSAYAAAKHGVVGLTKSAAIEYARKGIRVNAVCPAFTETPMVAGLREVNPKLGEALPSTMPMGRLGEPSEIAAAILFLASDQASFITGTAFPVDGGKAAT